MSKKSFIKKISLSVISLLALIIAVPFFSACGEEFIIEKEYQLIGMQVIADNTEVDGYVNWEAGSFHEAFIGFEGDDGSGDSMLVKDCVIDAGRKQTKLIWNKGDFKAEFIFDIVSDKTEYPVFSYTNSNAEYKGINIENLTNEEKENISGLLDRYLIFSQTLSAYESNLQFITQNRTIALYFSLIDRANTKCVYLCQVYGINK